MRKRLARIFPLHSLMIGLYPVLALMATNRAELQSMAPFLSLRSLIVAVLFVLVLHLIFWPIARSPEAGAILTSFSLALFYTYGHVENLLTQREVATNWLLPFWGLIWLTGIILILRGREKVISAAGTLTIIAVILLMFPVFDLVSYKIRLAATDETTAAEVVFDQPANGQSSSEDRPAPRENLVTSGYTQPFDIYYIVLDGYGRADILADIYDFDNQPFLDELEARGFYIASQSNANYNQTRLSIPAAFNMTYMQDLGIDADTPFSLEDHLAMLGSARLFEYLSEEQGYHLANFRSGYQLVDIQSLDTFMQPEGAKTVTYGDLPTVQVFGRTLALSGFEILLLQTTVLDPFLPAMLQSTSESPLYQEHRERILYTFEHLPDFALMEGEFFVYAHIPAPHPPFVYFADGSPRAHLLPFEMSDGSQYLAKLGGRAEYISRYTAQLSYINTLVLDTIDAILANSETPPVIILQADHGPGAYFDWESINNTYLPERLGILNAYYFPDGNYANLYPSITPVNSFRVVLDQYFGAQLGLLEDRSYFSTFDEPYEFNEVTSELKH
jgi:hypothetical protein